MRSPCHDQVSCQDFANSTGTKAILHGICNCDAARLDSTIRDGRRCSCRMGNDDEAVVDTEMKVHGIDGLRVVDASVMPTIVSANLNAPTQMIAARAADFILGKPALPAEFARFHFQ